MRRGFITIAATAAVVVAFAAPAFAHVTVQPNEAVSESFSRFVFRVPNERDDASTVKLVVQFPPLAAVSFMDVPGWTRSVKMQKLDEPMEVFGEEVNEAVGTVTWTGGEIAPGEFAEFGWSALMPAGENDLEFKALQTYSGGEVVRWTGPEDADSPAPHLITVELGDLGEGHGQLGTLHEVVHELEETIARVDQVEAATGAMDHSTEAADTEDEDSNLGVILGGVGTALGAIALLLVLFKKSK
jgi:uncharacterized protein